MSTSYNLKYNTWFESNQKWALTIQLTGPLPFTYFLNHHPKIISIACPLEQVEQLSNTDTPYYFKQWRDLDKAINLLEQNKDYIIHYILLELDEDLC